MRKIKVMIASLLGVIALFFAVVFGVGVSAAVGNGLIVDFGNATDYGLADPSTKPSIKENTILDGTIYEIMATESSKCSLDTNSKTIDNHSLTARFKTGQTSSKTDASIKINAPSSGELLVYGMSSKASNTRRLALYDSSYVDKNSTALDSGFSNDGNSIGGYTFTISSSGTYYIGTPDSGFNIYYIEFIADSVTEPTVELNFQYDTVNPAEATKIRMIAVMDDIAEVSTIDRVVFSVTVNNVTRTFACTQVYSGIASLKEAYSAKTGRYYAVYTLTGIKNLTSKLENLTVTISFTSGSGIDPIEGTHASFNLGSTTEVE